MITSPRRLCPLLIERNRCPVVMQAGLKRNFVTHWILILSKKKLAEIIVGVNSFGRVTHKAAVPLRITQISFWAWVRERTIPIERPPLVGEASANFCG
jgi:hypothetical protein